MACALCVTISNRAFSNKAEAKRGIAFVTREMQASSYTELSAQRFLALVRRGHSWCGGCFRPSDGRWGSFVRMRLFGLDFDDAASITPDMVVARCREYGVVPFAHYQTLSATSASPRFRLVVDAGSPFLERGQAMGYLRLLLRLFPEADQSCKNLNRIFFGSNGIVVPHDLSRSDASASLRRLRDELGDLEEPDVPVAAGSGRVVRMSTHPSPKPATPEEREELERLKARAPLIALIRELTGDVGTRRGGRVDFPHCPVCGHNDDFSYYEDNNSWRCFSASNETGYAGGSYIDFVLACGLAKDVGAAIDMMREAVGEDAGPDGR